MSDHPQLAELLACPRCDAALSAGRDEGFDCRGCQVHYPRLDGMPFLFAAPQAARGDWQARVHHELRRLAARASQLDAELASDDLLDSTRERLTWVRDACRDQHQKLAELMTPLLAGGEPAARETYVALRTRLPSDQGLNTYYQNVHRDWAWGQAENAAARDIVASLMPKAPGKVLVLGAGAGRLAYDLHQGTAAQLTVGLDFNPLLLGIASRVSRGEAVELWEFPLAPRSAKDQACLRRLQADATRPGLEFVLGDALRAPFLRHSFDTVVTPWLVDILPVDFGDFAARINPLLATGGRWINFGSLTFDTPAEGQRYGWDECAELLALAGFDVCERRDDRLPYMCSPASRHAREEEVLSFAANKTQQLKAPPRHQALPEWLVTGRQPVPALPAFQAQAAANRIHAFVMGLIDGRRSIDDMAQLMESQRLMQKQEADGVLRNFLTRMYEDSQRSP